MVTRRLLALASCGVAAVGLAACEGGGDGTPTGADMIAGKQAFVQKCGSCHVLSRAGTKGNVGPNLDEAFREALSDGFGRGGVRGIVAHQIDTPARLPKTSKVYMPADLVKGDRVHDVAAYVAYAAARKGKDTGLLGSAVKPAGAGKPVAAKGGKLAIPADPTGQLAYITKQATAPAGQLEIDSVNKSTVPHDIAVEGNGVNEKGPEVSGGKTSKINVSLKPGKYTFFCTVQGHREGGMEGTLTVK
jgi:plastocyanin